MVGGQVHGSGLFGQQFVSRPVEAPAFGVSHDQHAFSAIEGRSVFVTFLNVRRPDALFKDQLSSASGGVACNRIFADGVLGIRELLIIIEKGLAAEAGDAGRVRRHAQSPECDVDVVDAIIADISTAKVIPPAPDAVQQVGPPRHGLGRAQPGVKIEVFGRCGWLRVTDGSAALAVPRLCDKDLADFPFL